MQGLIVCGHPDRNVARLVLRAGDTPVTVYLKREHRVEEILPYSAENGAGKSELWKVIRESALTDDAKNKRD